jgi:hypothetical protein
LIKNIFSNFWKGLEKNSLVFHYERVEPKCVEQLSLHDIATLDTQHMAFSITTLSIKGLMEENQLYTEREMAAHIPVKS